MSKSNSSELRWNADNGIINYCNGSFSSKCDAAPNEIIGKHITDLKTDNGVQLIHLAELKLIPGELQTDTLLWKSKDGIEHSELTTVQALTEDGKNISEIQVKGLDNPDELKYRNTLDALLDVFSDNDYGCGNKTERMLNIGLDYFAMQSGVVGSAMGSSLEVLCSVGQLANMAKLGNKLPLKGTVCLEVLDSDEVIAICDLPQSKYAKTCTGVPAGMRSYIGTQVATSNGPLGVLSFFSTNEREQPFTCQDKRVISLIANWVGNAIGNEEQLEFLSLQNDYYQSLFHTVPAMMMLCNEDGLILSTSDRLASKIGIAPPNVPGQNCHRFFTENDQLSLTNALRTGEVNHLPLTLCNINGDTLDIELNSSIKHIGSMQGVRMIVLADVSERNLAMSAIEEQNKQLALVNQSLNQFAFIASHDLQEPLRKIQQFSVFLEEDMGEIMTKDGQYHLDVIVNSAKRMTTLIQDLLAFSSAAKGELVLTDINLNELMAEVRSELELRIEESNAQLNFSNLPTVSGDTTLVRQLFTNLVSNSLKYRDENRDPVITIASEIYDNVQTVTITDNGIGFDQKQASRAFEPFSRLHTNKKYNGNGIGLSICATVCEKHDWKLSATSKPNAGSVFTVTIKNTD